MQSKVSNANLYRVPAATRCSVLRSLIPNILPLGPSTERWCKPPRAVEKSEGSSRDIVTDEAVSRDWTQAPKSKRQGSLLVLHKDKADGLDPDLKAPDRRPTTIAHGLSPPLTLYPRGRTCAPVQPP
eukprot:gene15886-22014_t